MAVRKLRGTYLGNITYAAGIKTPGYIRLYDAEDNLLASLTVEEFAIEDDYEDYYQGSRRNVYYRGWYDENDDETAYVKNDPMYVIYALYPTTTKIIIPDSVTKIGKNVFCDMDNIEEVEIEGNGLKEIGEYAFCYTNVKSFVVPSSVKKIGTRAFDNMVFESLTINGNPQLGEFIVSGHLTTFNLGTQIKEIPEYAFATREHGNTLEIDTVVIPSSVTYIDESAFYNTTISEIINNSEYKNNYPWYAIYQVLKLNCPSIHDYDEYGSEVEYNTSAQIPSFDENSFYVNSEVTMTFVPCDEDGYEFVSWWDGNTDNPRTVTITESFVNSFNNAEFILKSKKKTKTLSLSIESGANGENNILARWEDDEEKELVTTGETVTAEIPFDTRVDISVNCDYNYEFAWNEETLNLGFDSNYEYIYIKYDDISIGGSFKRVCNLTYEDEEILGNVGNLGSTLFITPETDAYGNTMMDNNGYAYLFEGTTVTMKAVANDGYKFVGWYDSIIMSGYDDPKLVSTDEQITFVINDDMIRVPYFEPIN